MKEEQPQQRLKGQPFDELDGNIQGFASGRKVAINPVAAMPAKTLFHELAHVVLGHTAEASMNDGRERTPRSLREVEAECVALLSCPSTLIARGNYALFKSNNRLCPRDP